jgi:hypothetical protein
LEILETSAVSLLTLKWPDDGLARVYSSEFSSQSDLIITTLSLNVSLTLCLSLSLPLTLTSPPPPLPVGAYEHSSKAVVHLRECTFGTSMDRNPSSTVNPSLPLILVTKPVSPTTASSFLSFLFTSPSFSYSLDDISYSSS